MVNIFYLSALTGQPDADYFRIDLPNSGEVILAKPLDYETKTVLAVTIHASVSNGNKLENVLGGVSEFQNVISHCHNCQEMSTAEHFNTSTTVTITVLDADDQYPQFLPCVLLFQDETSRVCMSPVYTVNVTEGEEVTVDTQSAVYTPVKRVRL